MDFANRHFIISGGTGTLGSAVTGQLLEDGASCSIPCYDTSELEHFDYTNHEDIYIQTGVDLTDEQATQNFYTMATEQKGPLWASIHIAGGFGMGSIEDTSLADFNKQLQLNTVTCYNACRAAIQWMRESEYGGGRIVNIAARPALEPRQGKGMTAYTVAKAGVAALTESLAAEVVGDGILVNAIAPSIIDTPQNRESMPDAHYDDWPKPGQLARQITYLASPSNEVTRGSVVTVYGKS